MMSFFVVLSLTLICFSTFGETSRCDPNITRMIRERFWNNGRCVPKEILRLDAYSNPAITKRTTKGFSPNEDKTACSYTIFKGRFLTLYKQNVNSNIVQESTYKLNSTEKDGVFIIDIDRKMQLHYLYVNRYGVKAFYRCTEEGEIGEPDGIIKVSGKGYDKDSYAQSIKDMESLGIIMSDKVFSDSCVK